MKISKQKQAEQAEALETLRQWIKPGSTVYTVLEHVSKSGMSRNIRVVVPYVREDGSVDFVHPNHNVSVVTGYRRAKSGDGLVLGGCGMDMGFQLVYQLSQAMFPEGFECVGERCPSNDHSNGDRDYTKHIEGAEAVGLPAAAPERRLCAAPELAVMSTLTLARLTPEERELLAWFEIAALRAERSKRRLASKSVREFLGPRHEEGVR